MRMRYFLCESLTNLYENVQYFANLHGIREYSFSPRFLGCLSQLYLRFLSTGSLHFLSNSTSIFSRCVVNTCICKLYAVVQVFPQPFGHKNDGRFSACCICRCDFKFFFSPKLRPHSLQMNFNENKSIKNN